MQRARPPSATLLATAKFDIGGAAPAPAMQVPEISARDLELVRVLGRGGQKTVSLCRHRPTGALVVRCTVADALSLAVSAASAPLLLQRLYAEFRAEVAILSSLKHHKNIVKLLALVSDSLEDDARAAARPGVGAIGNFPGFGGPPCASHMRRLEQADAKAGAAPADAGGNSLSFLLEYCGFGSLRDAMHSPAIELTEALKVRIAKSCARAVHFLHSQPSPIIHHDIKPGNILLTKDLVVRLCDFGLSKTQVHTSGLAVSTRSAVGTVNYMAPESFTEAQARVTVKVDVWSFGVLLVELFGRGNVIPYSGFHANAVPFQISQGNVPPELDAVEPESLRAMIRTVCLVRDERSRGTMLDALTHLRAIFPDAQYPDEPDCEADEVAAGEIRRRHAAEPPVKYLKDFLARAADEQVGMQKRVQQVAAVAAAAAALPAPEPKSALQAFANQVPARPGSAKVAAAHQVYVLGKTSMDLRVNECLASPGFVDALQRPSVHLPEPSSDEQRLLIAAPQYRAFRPQGPTQYQPPPPLPAKQVLDRARNMAAGAGAVARVAAPAMAPVSTKSTSSGSRSGGAARSGTYATGL